MRTKFVGITSITILSLIVLAGCGTTNSSSSNSSGAKASTNKSKPANTKNKIGEKVKINGLVVTITSASFTKPDQYTKPNKGNVLTLGVKVDNNSKDQQYVDDTDFTLSTGKKMDKEYFGYDQEPISAQINSGKEATGKLFFDVPKAKSYELQFEAEDSLSNAKVTWDIPQSSVK